MSGKKHYITPEWPLVKVGSHVCRRINPLMKYPERLIWLAIRSAKQRLQDVNRTVEHFFLQRLLIIASATIRSWISDTSTQLGFSQEALDFDSLSPLVTVVPVRTASHSCNPYNPLAVFVINSAVIPVPCTLSVYSPFHLISRNGVIF